jgi:hypothetical protein
MTCLTNGPCDIDAFSIPPSLVDNIREFIEAVIGVKRQPAANGRTRH